MRFCTVPRDTPRCRASVALGSRPSSRSSAISRRSMSSSAGAGVPSAIPGDLRNHADLFDRLLAFRQPPPLAILAATFRQPRWSPACSTPSETAPMTTTRSLDIALLGAGLELGAAARGAADGRRRRCAPPGLVRVLADLGHRVADRGTLHEVAPEPVAMEPRPRRALQPPRPRSPAGPARIHDRAYAMAAEPGVPLFLGGDHAISMGTITGVARARAGAGPRDRRALARRPRRLQHPRDHALGQHARHGARLRSPATRSSRRCSATGRSTPIAPADIHALRRPLDRPEREGAARAPTASTPSTCARSTSAASRRCSPSASPAGRRAASRSHVSFDVDFLDPAVAPGTGTVVPGRRHLPRGAPGDGDALRLRPRRLGRRGRAQPLPRRARPHRGRRHRAGREPLRPHRARPRARRRVAA